MRGFTGTEEGGGLQAGVEALGGVGWIRFFMGCPCGSRRVSGAPGPLWLGPASRVEICLGTLRGSCAG